MKRFLMAAAGVLAATAVNATEPHAHISLQGPCFRAAPALANLKADGYRVVATGVFSTTFYHTWTNGRILLVTVLKDRDLCYAVIAEEVEPQVPQLPE